MNNFIIKEKNEINVLNKLKKDGVCIIKNYINKKNLENILLEFENILIENKDKLDKSKFNFCLRKIFDLRTNNNNTKLINKKYKIINNILTCNFFKKISTLVLKKWNYDSLFIHKDFQNENTNNVFPHFDFNRKLKYYLCLNKMNLNNGCFKILPNSLKITERYRKNNKRLNVFKKGHKYFSGLEIKIKDLIPIIAEAGDLIIFDTNCIHCGGDFFEMNKCRKVIRLHIKKN